MNIAILLGYYRVEYKSSSPIVRSKSKYTISQRLSIPGRGAEQAYYRKLKYLPRYWSTKSFTKLWIVRLSGGGGCGCDEEKLNPP